MLQRLTTAVKAMRGVPMLERGRRPPIQVKQAPYAFPVWRDGKPEWHVADLRAYIEEGFNLNSLIYSAIMYKARAVRAAPLRAYLGDIDKPKPAPPKHPMARLLARPNPYQSGAEFQGLSQVYFNLMGNVFVHNDRPRSGALPVALRLLRPDRVYIIPAEKGLRGYLYVPEGKGITDGVPILPEDMTHIKLPHPGDPLEGLGYGLPPLAPMAPSVDVDNQVTHFLKVFFDKGTMISSLIVSKDPLTEDDVARIRNRWREIYGGAENWAEVGVLDGTAATFQRLSMTFQEMGFEVIDERNESRILGPFGVPPILIGTRTGLARSTYSNAEQARKAFWQDTLVPELNLHEGEYQFSLTSDDGAFPMYDYSKAPAMQTDIAPLVESAQRLWGMGVPANTALDAVGLPLGNIPGGDTGYLPLNVVPIVNGLPQLPARTEAGGGDGEPDGEPEADDMEDGARAGTEVRKASQRPFVNGRRPPATSLRP